MQPSAVFRAFTTNGRINRQAVGTGSRFDNLAKIESVLVPKLLKQNSASNYWTAT